MRPDDGAGGDAGDEGGDNDGDEGGVKDGETAAAGTGTVMLDCDKLRILEVIRLKTLECALDVAAPSSPSETGGSAMSLNDS